MFIIFYFYQKKNGGVAHRVAHRVAHELAHRVAHGLAHGPRPRFCSHPNQRCVMTNSGQLSDILHCNLPRQNVHYR